MSKSLLSAAAIAVLFTSCVKEIDPSVNVADVNTNISANERSFSPTETAAGFVANEILIRFKPGTSHAGRALALSQISGTIKEQVLTKTMQLNGDNEGFFVVTVPIGVANALQKMHKNPVVESSEPNYIVSTTQVSDDPYYLGITGNLWGMYSNDLPDAVGAASTTNVFASQAEKAWNNGNTGSNNVIVGVIDTGIDIDHEDLQGNIWTNPNEIDNDGIDNDGNGYIDDVHGWNFVAETKNVKDDNKHGTHVSGTIGARGGNTLGVAGVCWNVSLIAAKFLGASGSGSTANGVKAVDYITGLKSKNPGIIATNNSWGGTNKSRELENAIKRANTAGILFIAAAGNRNYDMNSVPLRHYPASYQIENIISVASIDNNGNKSSFSNYGSKIVHLAAPGRGIYSSTLLNTYASLDGTSMATPHVTGACALYASVHGGATAATIKNAILSGVQPLSSLSGKVITGGTLDAWKSLSK